MTGAQSGTVPELIEGGAIVGAGIAGLTLGAALRPARLPIELFDAYSPARARPDRGLLLWQGALAALERIGLAPALLAEGLPVDRVALTNAAGEVFLELPPVGQGGVVEGVAIRASRLRAILLAACADVPRRTPRRLLGYGEDHRGVSLFFVGGFTLRSQYAVGADGVASQVRLQCLDDGPPRYSGDSVWDGIAPGNAGLQADTMSLFWAPGGVRAGAVAVDRDGHVAWWVDLATGRGGDREEGPQKPRLRLELEQLRGPIRELVEMTPEAAIRRTDVLARRRAATGGRGRVTLIGDASHPLPITMRMGAALAIEDAVALAEALAAEPDPEAALRGYERLRSPRLGWVAEMVWRLRGLETRTSAPAVRARDFLLSRLPERSVRRFFSRLCCGP